MHKSNLEPQTSHFATTTDEFIQLSPIGMFPHGHGIQNVDKAAVETLVANFKSFFARLGRRFAGLPFYVGHPDVQGLQNTYPDRKAYGWIMDLEAREDGLYGRPKWSAAGRDLIANGHYKFLSPTWTAERVKTDDGRAVFRPTHLISVGFTNQPNLPVFPLANSDSQDEETLIGTPLPLNPNFNPNPNPNPTASDQTLVPASETPPSTKVGDDVRSLTLESATAPKTKQTESTTTSTQALPKNSEPSSFDPGTSDLPSNRPSTKVGDDVRSLTLKSASAANTKQTESTTASTQTLLPNSEPSPLDAHTSNLVARLDRYERDLANLHGHLITTVLDNAISQGRILPIERKLWHNELTENFESTSAVLANTPAQLNLTSKTENLYRKDSTPQNPGQKQKRILALVNEKMHSTGLDYNQAWLEIKSAHRDLFS